MKSQRTQRLSLHTYHSSCPQIHTLKQVARVHVKASCSARDLSSTIERSNHDLTTTAQIGLLAPRLLKSARPVITNPMTTSEPLAAWLRELAQFADLSSAERGQLRAHAAQISIGGPADGEMLVTALNNQPPTAAADPIVTIVLEKLGRTMLEGADRWPLTQDTVAAWQQLYRQLGPESRARAHLLRALSAHGGAAPLGAVAELLVSDPPRQSEDALLALSPLFQPRPYAAQALFPRLLDALEHPVLAAVILDLANYATRQHALPRHPAAERAPQLSALLEAVLNRLERVEEHPQDFATSAQSC